MKMEIERKFMVKTVPEKLYNYDSNEIEQHYLGNYPEIRIRKKVEMFNEYSLTIKSEGHLSRKEFEFEIDKERYLELKTMKIKSIEKSRFIIPDGNNIYELDVYSSIPGLIMVEVEFSSEKEAEEFIKPDWFGEELTYIEEFKSKSLASGAVPSQLPCLECAGFADMLDYHCHSCDNKGYLKIKDVNLDSYNNYAKKLEDEGEKY